MDILLLFIPQGGAVVESMSRLMRCTGLVRLQQAGNYVWYDAATESYVTI